MLNWRAGTDFENIYTVSRGSAVAGHGQRRIQSNA